MFPHASVTIQVLSIVPEAEHPASALTTSVDVAIGAGKIIEGIVCPTFNNPGDSVDGGVHPKSAPVLPVPVN